MRRLAADTRTLDRAAIALPCALAAGLSAVGITSRSLGFDEGATVAIVAQHGHALGAAIARDGGNMSGYYLLVHVLVAAFGNGLLVLRLPSAVFTAGTAALVGVLGLRLSDRRVAFVAGLLTAVSLPLVYWGQTARGYAPMVTFVCAGFIAFIALADPDESAPGGRRQLAWVGYVLAMVLATYSSFVAVLVVPVQLLAVVRRPRAARRLGCALLALGVCCVPLAVLAVNRGSGQLFWVPPPSRKVETQVLQSLTSAGLQPSFHPRVTTTAGVILTIIAVIAVAIVVLRARRPRGTPGSRGPAPRLAGWPAAMTVGWAVVPAVLTFVYSLVSQPIFLPRNLLTSVPAVSLLLALGICHPRLPRAAAAAALLVVVAVRALPLASSYGVSPEPWQAATADVLAAARPGDCIAFYPEDGRNAFQYYTGAGPPARRAPRSILPVAPWGEVTPYVERYATLSAAQLAARSATCRRIWFVSSHEGQTDASALSLEHRALYHRFGAELRRAFGPGPVTTYGYASAVHVELLSGAGRRRPG